MRYSIVVLLVGAVILLVTSSGCLGIPEGVRAVTGFKLDRYLGKWYEVARLDHSFERGLSRVTADYSLRPDGGVKVLNRGYNAGKGKWKEAEGKAFPLESPETGRFKVSFFGPFYASYNIIDLDADNYAWALVCGPKRNYLWILSRTPSLERAVRDRLVEKARAWGFPVDQLIWVEHRQ
ncbi:MAG: lipocalin family protein [Acidobacteria bacterium]|nr:lipocalin family protein [Acidobacteriota bacterium]